MDFVREMLAEGDAAAPEMLAPLSPDEIFMEHESGRNRADRQQGERHQHRPRAIVRVIAARARGRRVALVRFVDQFRLLHAFLYHKWYFDELYDLIFVRPGMWLGRMLWKKGDEGTIDRFGPDGAATAVFAGTRLTTRIQTGYVYTYALVMLLGVAAATTWAMAQ